MTAKKVPKPGTKEFAAFMGDHFISLVETLRDVVGEDVFGEYCSFVSGIIYYEKTNKGICLCARGNVDVSVKMLAQLMFLAAENYAQGNDVDQTAAMNKVLHDFHQEVMSTERRDFS